MSVGFRVCSPLCQTLKVTGFPNLTLTFQRHKLSLRENENQMETTKMGLYRELEQNSRTGTVDSSCAQYRLVLISLLRTLQAELRMPKLKNVGS